MKQFFTQKFIELFDKTKNIEKIIPNNQEPNISLNKKSFEKTPTQVQSNKEINNFKSSDHGSDNAHVDLMPSISQFRGILSDSDLINPPNLTSADITLAINMISEQINFNDSENDISPLNYLKQFEQIATLHHLPKSYWVPCFKRTIKS